MVGLQKGFLMGIPFLGLNCFWKQQQMRRSNLRKTLLVLHLEGLRSLDVPQQMLFILRENSPCLRKSKLL